MDRDRHTNARKCGSGDAAAGARETGGVASHAIAMVARCTATQRASTSALRRCAIHSDVSRVYLALGAASRGAFQAAIDAVGLRC
jgi:hypothetical protein